VLITLKKITCVGGDDTVQARRGAQPSPRWKHQERDKKCANVWMGGRPIQFHRAAFVENMSIVLT